MPVMTRIRSRARRSESRRAGKSICAKGTDEPVCARVYPGRTDYRDGHDRHPGGGCAAALFDQNVFEARGFLDETRALLRYAQKTAVAQRRTVCVTFASGGVALTIAGVAGASVCNTPLALPYVPRGGAGLASSMAGFQFQSTGATGQAANVTVTVSGATGTITVDAATGHVF